MSTKLYVGGLAYATTENVLKAHFEKHGTVETVSIITDRESGQSKGFGFVEMASSEEAQKAITDLHSKDLDGRKLTVNQAKPRPDRR